MKKGLLILTAALMGAFLFASFSTVSAEPKAPIECVMDIVYDDHEDEVYYWYGPVSGCILEGHIRFDADEENPAYVTGNMLHFFEKFTIYPKGGGEIYGINAGVGDIFNKYKFRANGWVTDTTKPKEWAYLIGYKTFEMGTSSDPFDPPIFAPDTLLRLVPAQKK